MQLTLAGADAEVLGEILSGYLSDLRMEIADTDAQAFREMLKQREALLKRLIAELGRAAAA